MFGRDEGFYYRATGAELTGTREAEFGGGTHIEWRAFAEQQRTAAVKTNFRCQRRRFPGEHQCAARIPMTGAAVRFDEPARSRPARTPALHAISVSRRRTGDSLYGRGALDLTASHGLGRLAAVADVSRRKLARRLPAQRLWYLGGSQRCAARVPTRRSSGNAFWLTRAELGSNDRRHASERILPISAGLVIETCGDIVRPMSVASALALSFLDGLFRFDVARGIYPRRSSSGSISISRRSSSRTASGDAGVSAGSAGVAFPRGSRSLVVSMRNASRRRIDY